MEECRGDYCECLNKAEIEEMQRYNRMAAEKATKAREEIGALRRRVEGLKEKCIHLVNYKTYEDFQRVDDLKDKSKAQRAEIARLEDSVTYWIAEGDKIRGKLNEALDTQVRIAEVRDGEIARLRLTIDGLCDRG